MSGTKVGSLSVKLKLTDKYKVLFTLSKTQGQIWKNANVSIGAQKDFEIIFEASKGDSYSASIALDDVRFYGCFAGEFCIEPG